MKGKSMKKMKTIMMMTIVALALCGGCMSPSGETGRSIRNTQNIRDCEIHVNVYAAPASSNVVAALDGVMPEIKILAVDGLVSAEHTGDRRGSSTSVSDMLKQSGGSTASILDALFGSAVRAVSGAAPTPPEAKATAGDCADGECE